MDRVEKGDGLTPGQASSPTTVAGASPLPYCSELDWLLCSVDTSVTSWKGPWGVWWKARVEEGTGRGRGEPRSPGTRSSTSLVRMIVAQGDEPTFCPTGRERQRPRPQKHLTGISR